jgi:4-amino-4-deoxy-L-arabinose transferase-like glycosyltransferase
MSSEDQSKGIRTKKMYSDDTNNLRDKPTSSSQFRVVLAIAFLITSVFQGSRGLYETTEGRYAECGREMLIAGKYLEPTLDFKPHWTKPPMTYWAIAGGDVSSRKKCLGSWRLSVFLWPWGNISMEWFQNKASSYMVSYGSSS